MTRFVLVLAATCLAAVAVVATQAMLSDSHGPGSGAPVRSGFIPQADPARVMIASP